MNEQAQVSEYRSDFKKEGVIRRDELSAKRQMAISALKKAKEIEAAQSKRESRHVIVNGKHTLITFVGDNINHKFDSFCADIIANKFENGNVC